MKKYPNIYRLCCVVSSFYFYAKFKITVVGRENIPKDGAMVLCSNHISNHDPILIGMHMKRQAHFMAKKELFGTPLGEFIFYGIGAFPLDRSVPMDMKAFKSALNILKEGKVLGIFAEGTRVKEGEKVEPKAGVAMLAVKGNAVVLPVAISANYKFRSRVTIEYGKPMEFSEYREGKITTEKMAEMTAKIMERIDEMKVK